MIPESSIILALQEAEGPPKIATQLIAIAKQQGISEHDLKNWIRHHLKGQEWSGQEFAKWCEKYRRLVEAIKPKETAE